MKSLCIGVTALALLSGTAAIAADRPVQHTPLEVTTAPRDGKQVLHLPTVDTLPVGAPSALAVQIERITLQGVTVLPEETYRAIIEPYEHRVLTSYDLDTLRHQLTSMFIDAGYISSGVIIPDQALTDGNLKFKAVEGRLRDVRIRASHGLSHRYLAGRLDAPTDEPVNVQALTRAIARLQSDTRVERVSARLIPAPGQGEALLEVDVIESAHRRLVLQADNHRTESVGAERLTITLANDSFLGHGDSLELSVGASTGSLTGSSRYEMPLSSRWRFLAYGSRSDADIIEAPFDDLDIESTTDTAGLGLLRQLLRESDVDAALTAGFEYRSSRSELLGLPFSLAPGSVDGESDVRVAYLTLDWALRTATQALALRTSLRRGLDVWDATRRPAGAPIDADGQFTSLLGQARYVRRIGEQIQLDLRLLAQRAKDPLLSLEKLAIGGSTTVRGHRENLLVRDNGWAGAVELRWQPPEMRGVPGTLTFSAFLDGGSSWDEQNTAVSSLVRDTSDRRTIAAVGMGATWQPSPAWRIAVEYAQDVYDNFDRDDPRDGFSERGLQDRGLHFAISYTRRF